jgi:hypothetical protein
MLKHLTRSHVSLMIVSAVFGAVTTLAAQAITAGHKPPSMREAHKPSAMSAAAMQPASQNLSGTAADALVAPNSWKQYPQLTDY